MDEPRRLYRDPERAMIGGVCAGLGEYFHADPTVFRVVFGVLAVLGLFTRGISFLLVTVVYVAMWFLIPRPPDGERPPGVAP
ncbi:MAG TPA: PspC domain-containing protein [Candidatus Thermoplasmatota archaeon]|nr:PspC domain-containing protein [Candidatus Thermoplasmatota archaeon]